MQRYQRLTGEGLAYGIEKGQIDSFMKRRGYGNIVNIDSAGLSKLYCKGANNGRKVADVYAIVHAEVC